MTPGPTALCVGCKLEGVSGEGTGPACGSELVSWVCVHSFLSAGGQVD